MRKPRVFYAIPCGAFFSAQRDIIVSETRRHGATPYVDEINNITRPMWSGIARNIRSADYFVADISTRSPNVLLELGYALREKPLDRIAVFEAKSATLLSDLQAFTHAKYDSFRDFHDKLSLWLTSVLPTRARHRANSEIRPRVSFNDEFRDKDALSKWWWIPPSAFISFEGDGLKISNMRGFPLITSHLQLLMDYDFEFQAKILVERIGWVVMATTRTGDVVPTNWIMMNLDCNGRLRPHVGWVDHAGRRVGHNNPLQDNTHNIETGFRASIGSWFTLLTRVRSASIEVLHEGRSLYSFSAEDERYSRFWTGGVRHGQVGFRCDEGEVAVVNKIQVTAR